MCDGINNFLSYAHKKKFLNDFVVRERNYVKFHHLVISSHSHTVIYVSSLHPFRAKNKIKLICQKISLLTNKQKNLLCASLSLARNANKKKS